jgi:hypothetical protein
MSLGTARQIEAVPDGGEQWAAAHRRAGLDRLTILGHDEAAEEEAAKENDRFHDSPMVAVRHA